VRDLVEDFQFCLALERSDARYKDIEDDSQGPDIGSLVIAVVVAQYIRGDVIRLCHYNLTVPTTFLEDFRESSSRIVLVHSNANPKSMTFNSRESFLRKRIFSGFKSRWQIRWVWQ
jgi:hypothetical protein